MKPGGRPGCGAPGAPRSARPPPRRARCEPRRPGRARGRDVPRQSARRGVRRGGVRRRAARRGAAPRQTAGRRRAGGGAIAFRRAPSAPHTHKSLHNSARPPLASPAPRSRNPRDDTIARPRPATLCRLLAAALLAAALAARAAAADAPLPGAALPGAAPVAAPAAGSRAMPRLPSVFVTHGGARVHAAAREGRGRGDGGRRATRPGRDDEARRLARQARDETRPSSSPPPPNTHPYTTPTPKQAARCRCSATPRTRRSPRRSRRYHAASASRLRAPARPRCSSCRRTTRSVTRRCWRHRPGSCCMTTTASRRLPTSCAMRPLATPRSATRSRACSSERALWGEWGGQGGPRRPSGSCRVSTLHQARPTLATPEFCCRRPPLPPRTRPPGAPASRRAWRAPGAASTTARLCR
jgi:hypothetical protein